MRRTFASGKAEWGLLLALFLFGGLVTLMIRSVISGYHPAPLSRPVAASDEGVASQPPAPSVNVPRHPLLNSSKPAVTIVADDKSQAALARLRNIIEPGTEAKSDPGPQPKPNPPPAPATAFLELDATPVSPDSPDVVEAMKLLNQYRVAKSIDDKAPLLFRPEQTKTMMHDYYDLRKQLDPSPQRLFATAEIGFAGQRVLSLAFTAGDRNNRAVSANFHRSAGGLRLDWESFVGYCETPMAEFRSARPTKPLVFRVMVETDDYYNFEFDDPARFLSLRLHSPNGEDYVHGFCQRGTKDAARMIDALRLASSGVVSPLWNTGGGVAPRLPATVELAFPPKAQSDRCVQITRFIAAGWLALPAAKGAATQAAATTSR